jgi:hypothetical protein
VGARSATLDAEERYPDLFGATEDETDERPESEGGEPRGAAEPEHLTQTP